MIAISMIIRGSSTVFDFVYQVTKMAGSLTLVNNIIVISCYFTEIAPSFMIMFVLWKSYTEKRDKLLEKSRSEKESLVPSYNKAANYSEEDGRLDHTQTSTSVLKPQDSTIGPANEHSRTYIESLLDTVFSMSSDGDDDVNSNHATACPYTFY